MRHWNWNELFAAQTPVVCEEQKVRTGAPGLRHAAAMLLFVLATMTLVTAAGCGGSSHAATTQQTPQVAIAFSQAAPATMAPGASITAAAKVSNDDSNSGVAWSFNCQITGKSTRTICGTITYKGKSVSSAGQDPGWSASLSAASGDSVTYTAPAYFPGGTVYLRARAVANNAVDTITSVTVPSNISISFTQPPTGPVQGSAAQQVDASINGMGADAQVLYSLKCTTNSLGGCGWFGVVSTTPLFNSETYQANNGVSVAYTAPEAPPSGGTVTLVASSVLYPSVSTSATFTVNPQPTPPVAFGDAQSPALVGSGSGPFPSTIPVGGSVLISGNVFNDLTNAGVDWSLSCSSSTAGACGTLSAPHTPANTAVNNGELNFYPANAGVTYTAPATSPGGTVTLTAAATANPLVTTSTQFTIAQANANGMLDAFNGQFVFYISGRDQNHNEITNAVGGAYTMAGSFAVDGKGTIYGEEFDMMDYKLGFLTQYPGGNGSYTMGPSGRGQITFANLNYGLLRAGSRSFNVAFIDSDHALMSENDGFGSATGMMYRQNLNDVAAAANTGASLNGTYTLTLNGATREQPGQQLFIAGALTATPGSDGTITETSFVGDAGGLYGAISNVKATTKPVISSTYDALGRSKWGTLDLGAKVFSYANTTTPTLTAYMIDKNHYIVLLYPDKQYVLGGMLVAQPSTPSISGSYAFTESGVAASGATMAAGGVFACGGSGTMDTTSLGGTPTSKEAIKATCTSPSNGRGEIDLSGSSSGIGKFAAYPTVDGAVQLVEIDGSGPSGAGAALPQQTAAISAGTFYGKYATNLMTTTSKGFEGISGYALSDGISGVAGLADTDPFSYANNAATSADGVTLTGTYVADASGRFAGTLDTDQKLGVVSYVADLDHVLLLAADATAPGTGIFRRQRLPMFLLGTVTGLGDAGAAYKSVSLLQLSGGVMPFTYTLAGGTLPAGLSVDSSTGAVTGITSQPGAYPITIQVTDTTGQTVSGDTTVFVEAVGGVKVSFTKTPPSMMSLITPSSLTAVTSGDSSGQGINWSVSCSSGNCGSFSATQTLSGAATLFTPSPSLAPGATVTITAASVAETTRTASAQFTLENTSLALTAVDGSGTPIATPGSLQPSATVNFDATVTSDPLNAGVDWTLTCGAADCGAVVPSHTNSGDIATYTAPAQAPAGGYVYVTASSSSVAGAASTATLYVSNTAPPNSLLKGSSVILVSGQNSTSYYQHIIAGTLIGDGNGTFTDGHLSAQNGVNYLYRASLTSGSYSLDATGRGTLTLTVADWANMQPPMSSNNTVEFSVTFVTPTHAVLSEIDGWGVADGTLDLQNATDLAAFQQGTAGLNGTYSAYFSGSAGFPNDYQAGSAMSFTFNNGTTTETGAIIDYVLQSGVSSGKMSTPITLTLTPDKYGFIDMTKVNFGAGAGTGNGAGRVSPDAYMIDANHFAVAGLSPGTVEVAGYIVAQPTNPTLSGSYMFTANGADLSFNAQSVGGTFTCGGSSTADVGGSSPFTGVSGSATCGAITSGRGTLTITGLFASNGVQSYAVYPTLDQGLQLIEVDNYDAWGIGTAYPQTLTTPTAASFKGSYASVGHLNSGWGDVNDFTGLLTADGNSSVMGTVDGGAGLGDNATGFLDGSPEVGATLTGSFTADSSGRFPGTLSINGSGSTTRNGFFYLPDDSHILFLSTDPSSTAGQTGTVLLTPQQTLLK